MGKKNKSFEMNGISASPLKGLKRVSKSTKQNYERISNTKK